MKNIIVILIALFSFTSCVTVDSYQTRPTFYSYGYYGPKPIKRQYRPVKHRRYERLPKCYDGHKVMKPYKPTSPPIRPYTNWSRPPRPRPGRH